MKPDPVPEAEIRGFLAVYEARGGRDIVGPLLRSRALRMAPELAREVLELRAENERLREAAHTIAHEAHTEGRIYAHGGETETPAVFSERLARLVAHHLETSDEA